MDTLHIGLILATLLCSLVAGFVFAFAVVIMPGIGTLNDREFLQSFQVMDRVIQNRQPAFMLLWVGSIVTLVATCVIGFRQLVGIDQMLLLAAVIVYVLGVQLPTMTINVPLNNQLQTLDLESLDQQALVDAFCDQSTLDDVQQLVIAQLVCGQVDADRDIPAVVALPRRYRATYVPEHGFDEKAYYFGRNLHDHIAAGAHNLEGGSPPMLERSVYYAELSRESIQELADLSEKEGMDALQAVNRRAMQLQERDASRGSATRRMSFGIYFYRDPGASDDA